MEFKTMETEQTRRINWGTIQIDTNIKKEVNTKIEARKTPTDPCNSPAGFLNLRDLNTLLLKYIGVVHALEETEGGTKENSEIDWPIDDSHIQHLEKKYKTEVETWVKLCKDADGKISELKAEILKLEADKKKLVKSGKEQDGHLAEKDKIRKDLLDKIKTIKENLCGFLFQQEIFDGDLVRLHAELAFLTGELNLYISLNETEKIRGFDLEARKKSLEHDLSFQISILEKYLSSKRDKTSKKVTSLELSIKGEFAARLKVELEMLRNMFEESMRKCKEGFEIKYKSQITQLKTELHIAVSLHRSPEDKEKIREKITKLESLITKLEKKNLTLSQEWSELTVQRKTKESHFYAEMSKIEHEIDHQKEENARLHSVYEEMSSRLMMTNVEVGVYDKLLCPEMDRITIRHGDSFCLEEAADSMLLEEEQDCI